MRQSSYCTKMRFRFAPYSMRDVGTEHWTCWSDCKGLFVTAAKHCRVKRTDSFFLVNRTSPPVAQQQQQQQQRGRMRPSPRLPSNATSQYRFIGLVCQLLCGGYPPRPRPGSLQLNERTTLALPLQAIVFFPLPRKLPSRNSVFRADANYKSLKWVAHTRLPSVGFRSWSRFLAVSLQVTWVINPAVGCHYFPSGLQLLPQRLRGLLPILLLGEQRHNGCEQFA